jgi:AcrR family transcriptional regulator
VTADAPERRAALLQAVIESVGRHGLGSRSLRDLAADAGTSHRMLIHHFGSREGLLVAIVTEVERQQRELMQTLPSEPAVALPAMWQRLADPAMWPFERLFFECYARGCQGEAPFDRVVTALVDDWLAVFPRGVSRDAARLGLAVVRGLLLDLVATEDRRGVDRALQQFVALLAR